jgi:hypothetical protein
MPLYPVDFKLVSMVIAVMPTARERDSSCIEPCRTVRQKAKAGVKYAAAFAFVLHYEALLFPSHVSFSSIYTTNY